MSRPLFHILLGLALLSVAQPAAAQQEPLDGLIPVEQQVGDHGPLSTSLRWVQYGLNQPYNFNDLYQLPVGANSYVRRNSGLWAVFPRSLYVDTDDGVVTSVPAGTMFYIGGPDDVLPQIADQQANYIPLNAVPSSRVEESRIEAILLDRRLPSSVIEAVASTGRGAIDVTPRNTRVPVSEEVVAARSQWLAQVPSLEFINDESYRRRCVLAAIVQASRPNVEIGPVADSVTVNDQAAVGSSPSNSK
ncbi:MAG: hypothetical protein MK116_09360 [Phycisphaerales bacterium]|nr:hypothetical protein [Phycisphaerales bacterium]